MSYVDQHLLPGETVTFRTTLHWKLYLGAAALSVFVFLPLGIWALSSERKVLALAPLALALIALGAAYVRQRSSEFAVTNKRVVMKTGVLQTRSVELLLVKIEGIVVNQGLGGKLFGYGDLVVTGTGGTKELFTGIGAPFEFRRAVQAATDSGSGA
jgi:uncharacterized membrane protein YdbT with pleckstrin-like domain